ncbi:hypothetical protein, partial [Methylobacterium aquaticum]|uniref:hypothetical protein n=1 Tax=Methylobacterium aquaticum TaxID=270351 RepID=UPI001AEC5E89
MTGNATRIVARQRNRTWRRTGLGEVNGRLIENISSFILAIRRARASYGASLSIVHDSGVNPAGAGLSHS